MSSVFEARAAEPPPPASYWLTRFLFLRLLGLAYAVAFLILLQQGRPLIGEDGLMPAQEFLGRVLAARGSRAAAVLDVPSLFWLSASDGALTWCARTGLALSLLLLLGLANVPLLLLLWALYLSVVNVGQLFWGYGWEILLLETGILAVFCVPLLRAGPFPERTPMPAAVVWLLRWLLFRLMLGAGLIKLRGDPCWLDLSCLVYHYETQPLPNPLSWSLHQLPAGFHSLEVLFNHLVELVAPWALFATRRLRHFAGALLVLFQLLLILSGNLAFLNWLTLAVCAACFDDSLLARLAPAPLRRRVAALREREPEKGHALAASALVVVVALLSLNPVVNMLSPRQLMNTSFEPLHLVNTYGAFGSILRERYEIVLQGTLDPEPGAARWLDYEFPCKPGDVTRRPCVTSPYHYRLDWQMWFAAMSDPLDEPWLGAFAGKLLQADPGALGLLARDPFGGRPPRFVRAELYRYEFTRLGDPRGAWWKRTWAGEFLAPRPSVARLRAP